VTGKIDGVVDALLKVEEEAYENEAIDILNKAFKDSRAYRFKVRLDEVKARQLRRRFATLKEAGDKEGAQQAAREQLAFELEMYAEQAVNYPTDLNVKFELGRRQLLAGRTDEAIGSLQQAQRDPKRRLTAQNLLGRAFAVKGWHREASETYRRALDMEPPEELAKELHYNLAVSLDAMGEKEKALDHFSQVAQMDYNYRDVREQIERLRGETK
jgi:tetratricopeptide (TPR) repeat protein